MQEPNTNVQSFIKELGEDEDSDLVTQTLMISALSQIDLMPSLAAAADGHKASRRLGSYDSNAPASLAMRIASRCVEREGSVIKLMEP